MLGFDSFSSNSFASEINKNVTFTSVESTSEVGTISIAIPTVVTITGLESTSEVGTLSVRLLRLNPSRIVLVSSGAERIAYVPSQENRTVFVQKDRPRKVYVT